MSNLRRARKLTTRAWGCVRSSHQRGQRGRVSGSPPTGKSSFLLESRLSTSHWTASPHACWWVTKLTGLFWHELYFCGMVNNNKLPEKDNWIICSGRLDALPVLHALECTHLRIQEPCALVEIKSCLVLSGRHQLHRNDEIFFYFLFCSKNKKVFPRNVSHVMWLPFISRSLLLVQFCHDG